MLLKANSATTSRDALEAHLLLEKFVMGKFSKLGDPKQADKLNQLRETAAARDTAQEAWETDREGFVEGVFNQTEKKKLVGARKDNAKAKTAHLIQEAITGELSNQRLKRAELDHKIAHEPHVDVQASGKWVNIGRAGQATPVLEAERVNIMHRQYIFQPGLNQNVPKVFADQYEQITNSRAETAEREAVMGKGTDRNQVSGMTSNQLEAALSKIDKKYSTTRQLPS